MHPTKLRWTALGASLISATLAGCAAPDAVAPSADDDLALTPVGPDGADSGADAASRRDACTAIAPAPHYRDWPRVASAIRSDPRDEAWIRRLVAAMSLEQKIGQMTQAEIGSLWDASSASYQLGDLTRLGVGSVLNGGGSWPEFNKHAAVGDWIHLADAIWDASPVVSVPDRRGAIQVKIPAFWGIDAVHGNSNVFGATLFPHNIGLGATRDTCLVHDIGVATQRAVRATGQDWTFGPCLAVVRDDRWGRSYESWSEDPSVVRAFARAMNAGIMDVDRRGRSFRGILSTAKHYIADGGSTQGIDQGNVLASEDELRNVHAQGYFGAIESGVQTVMVGFFSWQDQGKDSGNKHLVDEILKQKIGFDGLVISDWNAIGQVAGCTNDHCPQAVNAGIDLFMVPQDWRTFIPNTIADVRAGLIPMSRIDDAVTRILRVKLRAGLFELPRPSERALANDPDNLVDRALARRAVRESLVLLKNNDAVLPLRADRKVLVVGKSADSIQNQTGGWSLSWQGGPWLFGPNDVNLNSDFPTGESILAGIRDKVGAANVTFSADASGVDVRDFDAVIAVVGETPYAETFGDVATAIGNRNSEDTALRTLELGVRMPEDRAVLRAVSGQGVPVVTVLVTGRALYANAELNLSDAFVVAWLPGTEGGGVADVLLRKHDGRIANDFTGRLPVSWPRAACQTSVNAGDASYDPQFAFGYGLTYRSRTQVGMLDETAGPLAGCP
ncbi:MAG TPA: glycoside hydrolase family 3 N-terminal domain-containing protein [Kofleriaceae bacterium]|nr:glycoside hydrolase family 3 N-terminal domain-containing protein [Kofleriaceae bacterium]